MTGGTSTRAIVKNTFLDFLELRQTEDGSTCTSPMASPRSVMSEPAAMVASARWPTSLRSAAAAKPVGACAEHEASVVLTSTLLEKLDMLAAEPPSTRCSARSSSEDELLEGRSTTTESTNWAAVTATTPKPRPPVQGDAGARASEGPATGKGPATGDGSWTTLMLQNLPIDYTRDMVLSFLDANGLAGRYNFFFYPLDYAKKAGLGYAFVNMLTSADAEYARAALAGFRHWSVPSNKVCSVGWSYPCQGLDANIERHRNSPVMHHLMDDEFKPMTFEGGVRTPFPRPTKKVPKPGYRIKRSKASF